MVTVIITAIKILLELIIIVLETIGILYTHIIHTYFKYSKNIIINTKKHMTIINKKIISNK